MEINPIDQRKIFLLAVPPPSRRLPVPLLPSQPRETRACERESRLLDLSARAERSRHETDETSCLLTAETSLSHLPLPQTTIPASRLGRSTPRRRERGGSRCFSARTAVVAPLLLPLFRPRPPPSLQGPSSTLPPRLVSTAPLFSLLLDRFIFWRARFVFLTLFPLSNVKQTNKLQVLLCRPRRRPEGRRRTRAPL